MKDRYDDPLHPQIQMNKNKLNTIKLIKLNKQNYKINIYLLNEKYTFVFKMI